MSTSIRTKALTGVAVAFLTLGMAACTDDTPPEPTPTVEPAPVEDPSDNGGADATASDAPDGPTSTEGECEVQEGSSELDKEAPPVDGWERVNGVGVPVSGTYGPFVQEGELWTCYEHSPTGAAFAATYVVAATCAVPGFAEAWVPESDYQDTLKEAEQEELPPSSPTTPAGFRVASYTPEQASVDVALEVGTDQGTRLVAMRWDLTWHGTEWKVDPEMGETGTEPLVLDSLEGFVSWGTTDG